MIRAIVENGAPHEAEIARQYLEEDTEIRNMRDERQKDVYVTSALLAESTPPAKYQVQREIFDVRKSKDRPRRLENQKPSRDAAIEQAFKGLGDVHDFYKYVYNRNSIDDQGMVLRAEVHYQDHRRGNAFWDGKRMLFGDGDGLYFQDFTSSLDIIGHELTHGVIQYTSQLDYSGQSGALAESLCDVMGSIIKQWKAKQSVDEADWLIGPDVLTTKVKDESAPSATRPALRSMKQPGTAFEHPVLGKDPQPDHMRKYDHRLDDHGGVHINSGIPNRAFYLASSAVGGYAWTKIGMIWYNSLSDKQLQPTSDFERFAILTLAKAEAFYGGVSVEYKAIHEAWREVGVIS
ncbi:MAG: M4 family metallopeptidase [Anaerolineae bacterium]|nr:M4 family metallopeptidase [Anaerolineae bacterium]